jgi:hypothetical protein
MAFQFGAFQANAFQQDNPTPPVSDDGNVHWYPFERALNGPDRTEQVRQERIRLGILPADAVKAVAKVAVEHKLDDTQYLALLDAELKQVGAQINAAYIKQFEKALAKKRADDDDEEAIGLLL